jgi:hypothetical protein
MARRAAVAGAVLAIAMSGIAAAASGAVYKCAGAEGVPLYTDLPCKGGTLVDIRPGTADPTAIARLTREQDRFAALALARAQRIDDEEVAATSANRGSSAAGGYEAYEGGSAFESGTDIIYAPVYLPVLVSPRPAFHRVHEHHDEHRERLHRFVPHHDGVIGTTRLVPQSTFATRFREPRPASQATAVAWK